MIPENKTVDLGESRYLRRRRLEAECDGLYEEAGWLRHSRDIIMPNNPVRKRMQRRHRFSSRGQYYGERLIRGFYCAYLATDEERCAVQ